MALIRVRLFGKFRVEAADGQPVNLEGRKLQELLAYLFLYRHKPHPREALAGLFWPNHSTARSKQYLRQSLWLIQSALAPAKTAPLPPVVIVEDEWVRVNPDSDFWLDVDAFEAVHGQYSQVPVRALGAPDVAALQVAADLYGGDLLEGSYPDWCLFERERLQNQFLGILHKLLESCALHGNYALGLTYGAQILQRDPAYERAHAHMMRLYWLTDNRTEALRQYRRCEQALAQELGVAPSRPTRALYDQITADKIEPDLVEEPANSRHLTLLADMLGRLQEFQATLQSLQTRVEGEIQAMETILKRALPFR